MAELAAEFIPFRFRVLLFAAEGSSAKDKSSGAPGQLVCAGAFSEVSGLEASMTPKKFQEGGWNYGERLRVGTTAFTPVTLKRGMTTNNDAYAWFELVTRGANYALRLSGRIEVLDAQQREPALTWMLTDVVPLKFKGSDLHAVNNQIAVEELQIAYEGLQLVRRSA